MESIRPKNIKNLIEINIKKDNIINYSNNNTAYSNSNCNIAVINEILLINEHKDIVFSDSPSSKENSQNHLNVDINIVNILNNEEIL